MDSETGLIYLRARYYDAAIGAFISEDPAHDGLNWYAYCAGDPVNFVDSWGTENIVIAGGAYHEGNGNYQFEFIDSALLQIKNMDGDATLLVANAGWDDDQYAAIVEAASDRGINLYWFSSISSLTSYINSGKDRSIDPIESFYVFAHGTDSGTGNYAVTFGLYTDKDENLRFYTKDISKINSNAFSTSSVSYFYSCRTGNTFNNGNFARKWADITKSDTWAFKATDGNIRHGKTNYGDILGTTWERHSKNKPWEDKNWRKWSNGRGSIIDKPGEAYQLPKPASNSSMVLFGAPKFLPAT